MMTSPLGSHEGQAGPHFLVEDEQRQFAAQFAVVPLAGLLEHLEVALQLLAVRPGGAVDPLQHGPVLVAAPVGAGHAHQLDALNRNLARVLHMGTAAQILEGVLGVGRDDLAALGFLAVLVHRAFDQALDQLQLVGFVDKQLAGLVGVDFPVHKRMLATDDAAHAPFNLLQILRQEGAGPTLFHAQVEVVVEAVLNRRPDGQPGVRIQFAHGLGHDMAAAVPNPVQPVFLRALLLAHRDYS